jgi:hypothetical protein
MADNILVDEGTAKTVATDDVAGVHYPRAKIDVGADGASAPWVAAALTDDAANPTIPGVAAYLLVWDGTTWDRARGSSGGGIHVDASVGGDVSLAANVTKIGGTYQVVGQVIDENGVVLTVKTANAAPASSGDNTIIAAVASKKIRVLAWSVQAQGTVTVRWEDGAGVNISAPWLLQAREGVVKPSGGGGAFYFQSSSGNALVLNLSAAITVGVEVTYVEV